MSLFLFWRLLNVHFKWPEYPDGSVIRKQSLDFMFSQVPKKSKHIFYIVKKETDNMDRKYSMSRALVSVVFYSYLHSCFYLFIYFLFCCYD